MMKSILSTGTLIALSLLAGQTQAEIRLDLDATSIIGNREVPRIVYLLAWRDAPKGDILEQSLETKHNTEIGPIDRDVFQRKISYYELMYQDKNKQ